MWLAILFIAMMYYVIHMIMALCDKKTYMNRTKGQIAVFTIVQALWLAFTVWMYIWSYDSSLVMMMIFLQIIGIAPVTLICLPPHSPKNNDDGGTIDWE